VLHIRVPGALGLSCRSVPNGFVHTYAGQSPRKNVFASAVIHVVFSASFSMASSASIEDFLRPLNVDIEKIHNLARSLKDTFENLAAESTDQFLSTPISESVLRPDFDDDDDERGRYVDFRTFLV
jgi:hypothetical protein